MPSCPSCRSDISGQEIAQRLTLKPYRLCPNCRQRFTVDSRTKRRQLIALILAVSSLIFTIGWCFVDQPWIVPSITSYIVLVGHIYRSSRLVEFVNFGQ